MPPSRDTAKAVKIDGKWYSLGDPAGQVTINQLGQFIRKFTVGDASADSDDYQSSLILSNFSGGIGVEDSDEGADTSRFWFGIIDSRSARMLALPPLVTATKPAGASGTARPIGVIGTQFYCAFDDDVYGWDDGSGAWHSTANAIAAAPVNKSVYFDGRMHIPQGASGITYCTETTPASGTLTDAQESDPAAVALAVWNNNLYAVTTTGALWRLVQGGDPNTDWAAVTNSAGDTLTLHTGETPKNLVTYFNRLGEPTLWLITDRSAYMYYETAVEWRQSNIQFPPHPDFGRSACVWRTGEDLWIAAATDVVRQTTGNAIVPLSSGLSRDQGLPEEYRGTIVDLQPEISCLYALVGGTSETSTAYEYAAKFGSTGTGDANFDTPGQIARDSSGNLYIADTENDRLKKHDSSGTFVDEITGLHDITGVAVDSSGNIYVAYTDLNIGPGAYRLRKYNSSHTAQWTVTSLFAAPVQLATDGTTLYVSYGNDTVLRRSCSSGAPATPAFFGDSGTGNGEFDTPRGIAVDGTHVYVVDQGNDRVQKFDLDGNFVAKWGTTGTGNGQFQNPVGIAVDSTLGLVFVTDSTRNDVQQFTTGGTFIRKFGATGSSDGQFTDPSGVCIEADGDVWVADSTADRLQRFTLNTTTTASVTSVPTLHGWSGTGWHGLWAGDDPDDEPTWMTVSATTSHYRLWWGMDDGNAYYLKLRRGFHNPNQGFLAGVDTFAASGFLITSKFDAGMLGFDKLASHVTVFPISATASETIEIQFAIDEGGWESLGTIDTSDVTTLSFGDDGRVFNSIQFRILLDRGSNTTLTPLLRAMTLLFVKIPQNARSMVFPIVLPKGDRGQWAKNAKAQSDALDALNNANRFFTVEYGDYTYEHCRIAGITGHDQVSDGGGQRNTNIVYLPVDDA